MKNLVSAICLAFVASIFASHGFAGDTCQCRADGQYYSTGAIICMGTGNNKQMARCEMALNNTSWKMLGEECPYAFSPDTEEQNNQSLWIKVSSVSSQH